MADFATPEELASYVQSDLDRSTAELALSITSAAIRASCGWSITEETDTVMTCDGTGRTTLFLPTLHLTEVSAVVENGVALLPGVYEWTGSGILRRLTPQLWTSNARGVLVTCTHGYTPVPADVKGACLEHSARILNSPEGGSRSYVVGNVSETFSAPNLMRSLDTDPRISTYRLPTLG